MFGDFIHWFTFWIQEDVIYIPLIIIIIGKTTTRT